MNHQDRIRIRFMILAVLAIVMIAVFTASADARELPELTTPEELSESWNGRRVTIFGYARDCEALQGRLRSNYYKCIVGTGLGHIVVYTDFKLYNVVGERVIVQGVYMDHGRFGGFLADDHFIVADTFIRDWEN